MSDATAPGRDAILAYIEREMIGPEHGPNEEIEDPPHRRYLMGTLFPQEAAGVEGLDEEDDAPTGTDDNGVTADDPVSLASQWMPSSIGMTFLFEGSPELEVRVWGARYTIIGRERPRRWRRRPEAEKTNPIVVRESAPADEGGRTRADVFRGAASLRCHWRRVAGRWLVTVSLVNETRQGGDKPDAVECLYQVGFSCAPVDGAILEYPSAARLTVDPEEEELSLLYRKAKTFAIGHGCAVVWDVDAGDTVSQVSTVLMPRHEVKGITHETTQTQDILDLARLSDADLPVETLVSELEGFLSDYRTWIDALPASNPDVPSGLDAARDRLLKRAGEAADRIETGIGLLRSDPIVLDAFRLANRAMLVQMAHAASHRAGTRRARNDEPYQAPGEEELSGRRWRPFQLAFFLLTLASVADLDDEDRDTLDLIWFPTGGGKTEAYLAVAAFEILLRRLRHGDAGGGTAVITRYTLRLLTSQQFRRTATMICACEQIRRERSAEMGDEPIRIGLWVGMGVVPNRYQEAFEKFTELRDQERPKNPFQLETCPWCGTEIIPRYFSHDDEDYGVTATSYSFAFNCPSDTCPFHDELPVGVVDDDLYDRPPALLIATVDKFARIAWEEKGGVFFGGDGRLPPSLVIQDELHLLSGPLGTTVGMYEAAFDALMAQRGARPKVIASTATIRRAGEQVKELFNRPVRLFPPSGLDADDSFFARTDREGPGRLYVGVMAPAHTTSTTAVHTISALLQAPFEVSLTQAETDAYWTLVAYHNSLRELGRTVTLVRDDVHARIRTLARDQADMRSLGDDDVIELTSHVSGSELPGILARMNLPGPDPEAISVVACTNMFSVGVDVPRLGLMLVNGQPKTTAEYIQSTSRVGRGRTPGLVVAMYSPNRPRDRSHYEGFVPYHAALYRHVEPTSVTPFSLPARERALHAAFVILVRHGAGLAENDAAIRFDENDPKIQAVTKALLERIAACDPGEHEAAARQLDRIIGEWHRRAEAAKYDETLLCYNSGTKAIGSILKSFESSVEGWPTLHSMRNVDRQCAIRVWGEEQDSA